MLGQKTLKKENELISVLGRVIAIIFTYLLVGGIFQYIGSVIVGFPIDPKQTITIEQFFILISFDLPVLLLTVYFFRKYIDKKSFKSMGFSMRKRYKDLFLGFIVAAFIIGFGTMILHSMNKIEIVGIKVNKTVLLKNFILFLAISINEEILMRGYILNNLMTVMNKYIALGLSALLFCFFHFFNSDISVLAIFNLFLAGILLGSVYIFTQNLWFPISLHLFWNFLQGPILGYNVSGEKVTSVLIIHHNEKNIITGGDFGFEGSIVCTILSFMLIVLILTFKNIKSQTLFLNE